VARSLQTGSLSSFSEDRPCHKKFTTLGDEGEMHLAVGSQLLIQSQSHVSFFVGAQLTSNRFLTVSRLQCWPLFGRSAIQRVRGDSTGTTELTKEESLKQSPAEDQIEI